MTTVDFAEDLTDQQAEAPGETLLRVDDLRVAFGDTEVVKGISFTARPAAAWRSWGSPGRARA